MTSLNPLNQSSANSIHDEQSGLIEIDLWRIMDFFAQQYKRLVLGASIGLILSLIGWFGFGAYKAEVIVPNQWGEIANIRALEASWASLASEIVSDPKLSSEERALYRALSSAGWWNQAVKVNYALTKADLKDMVNTAEIKSASILNLEVRWTGKNSHLIEQQLLQTVNFMRYASAYMTLRNTITGYEAQNFTAIAEIEKSLHDAQLGLIFANRRLSNLEELQKRFPGNALAANQVVDPKESGAKYLPISTQIIAAKSDIFATQESIKQLQTRLEQTQLLAQFVGQAKPLIPKERNGIKLAEQLLAIEAQLRTTIAADNLSLLVVLDRIRLDLTNIQAQYVVKVDHPLIPVVVRNTSWVAASVLGLFGGFLIALIICIGVQYWPLAKERLQSAKAARDAAETTKAAETAEKKSQELL